MSYATSVVVLNENSFLHSKNYSLQVELEQTIKPYTPQCLDWFWSELCQGSRFTLHLCDLWRLMVAGWSASCTAGMRQYRCQSYQKAAHHQSDIQLRNTTKKNIYSSASFLWAISVEGVGGQGDYFDDATQIRVDSGVSLSQLWASELRPRTQRSSPEEACVPPSKRWVIWAVGQRVMPAGQCTDTSFHPPITIWW